MTAQENCIHVLLVTASERTTQSLLPLLPRERFAPVRVAASAGEARRTMVERPADIAIVAPPLPDELGLRLAEDLSRYESTGVLLLVGAEQFERMSWPAESLGILLLSRPLNRMMFTQAVGLLCSMNRRLRKMEAQAEDLRRKAEDIRLVSRAKFLLMEREGLSEAEAHRHIEKTAMDRCVKRREIAGEIIRRYSQPNHSQASESQ